MCGLIVVYIYSFNRSFYIYKHVLQDLNTDDFKSKNMQIASCSASSTFWSR